MEGKENGKEGEEAEEEEGQKRRKKKLLGQMFVNFVGVDVALVVALFEAVFVIPGWRFPIRKFRV